MRFLSGIHAFGFTRNEIKVVLFLTATFLAGLAIRWYAESSEELPGAMMYDYTQSDQTFLERSEKLAELTKPPRPIASQRTPPPAKTLPPPNSININTASKEMLMQLPGIGEEYAERIILFREDHGPFESVEQLVKVRGIGKKSLERIRPYLTVD